MAGEEAATALTEEDIYNFDTAGWLHLRHVLTVSEQRAATAAVVEAGSDADALGAVARCLLEKPALRARVVQLVAHVPGNGDVWGDGAHLTQGSPVGGQTGELTLQTGAAALLAGTENETLAGGPGPDGIIDFTRTYIVDAGHRYIHGLVVVWAIQAGTAAGGYACVAGSLKTTLEVPVHLRSAARSAPLTNLGILQQPPIEAGDVLLVSSACLHGARQPDNGGAGPQLLRCEFFSHMARLEAPRARHDPSREPEWTQELTRVERTLIGLEPQHRAAGDEHPTVRVGSDGKVRLEDLDGEYHPSAMTRNSDRTAEEFEEMWLWETCGYLILRGVMDSSWVEAANATVEWALEQQEGADLLRNPMSLAKPFCIPFRKMLAHPAVLERLTWIFGIGFVHYAPGGVRLVEAQSGDGKQRIHAGQMDRSCDYHHIKHFNGRSYCASVNVSWQLADHCRYGGGLHVVPGSHRANYLLPATMSVHPTTHEDGPLPACTVHPDTKAGDVVIFSGMGTAHGVGAWRSEHQRRLVIMPYISRHMAVVSGHYGDSSFLTPVTAEAKL